MTTKDHLVLLELDDTCLIQNLETISHLQIGDKLRWEEHRQLLLVDRRLFRDIRRQLDHFTRHEMLETVTLIMEQSLNKYESQNKSSPQMVPQILKLPTIKHINWNRYITESIQGLRRMNQTYQHFEPLFRKIQQWTHQLENGGKESELD